MARQSHPAATPHLYRWFLDGHNLLLSSPRSVGLHGIGRSRGAREALDRWIESFGRAVGVQVCLVYDGATVGTQREVVDRPHLRVLYTDPPAEADDQIRLLAAGALRAGEWVCVVSSDHRTLGATLEPEVRILSVPEFRALHATVVRAPEKWVRSGDLDDIERHFLSSSPFASDRLAAAAEDAESPTRSKPPQDPVNPVDSEDPAGPGRPSSDDVDRRE